MVLLQFIFVLFSVYLNSKSCDDCTKNTINHNLNNNIEVYRKTWELINEYRKERIEERIEESNDKGNKDTSNYIKLSSGVIVDAKTLPTSVLVTYPAKDGVLVHKTYQFKLEPFKSIIEQ